MPSKRDQKPLNSKSIRVNSASYAKLPLMDAPWIAALPMYDYPELAAAHDAFWECFVRHFVATGLSEGAPPPRLTRGVGKRRISAIPR
jgi:hypothetical protein